MSPRRTRHSLALLALVAAMAGVTAWAAPQFTNSIDGTPLDFSDLNEVETEAVKTFKQTGQNPYRGQAEAIKKGESLFATACSGCHGHLAEGKLGPGLTDDYWTYEVNKDDVGLFSSIYGGLQGMMGPQKGLQTQDNILEIMAWLRSMAKDAKAGGQDAAAKP